MNNFYWTLCSLLFHSRYTQEDVVEVVEYAQSRGVRVMVNISHYCVYIINVAVGGVRYARACGKLVCWLS